jgi:hypothetical protein
MTEVISVTRKSSLMITFLLVCMTRGPGPPGWACWESEKRTHLERLHAACMAARPFRPLVGAKVEGHL